MQFQKYLMNRFEKFTSADFGPKKWPIYPILGKTRIFIKKRLPHFLLFIESWLHAKNQKKVMCKTRYKRTERWIDRAEIIGPSSKTGGPTNAKN